MTLSVSSESPKVWRLRDAAIVFFIPVLAPLAVVLSLRIWAAAGIVPRAWPALFAREDPFAAALQYALVLAVYGLLIGWLKWRRDARARDFGWLPFRSRWLAFAVVAYIIQVMLTILVFTTIKALWPNVNLENNQEILEFGLSGWGYALSFVSTVLLAPVFEETLYRGVMFPALGRKLPLWLAAVVSSAAFGLMHGELSVGIYTFILGLILCWMTRRSGSIIPGVVLHFLNNLFSFFLLISGK